ncbi:APC family permease [Specibacter cremeus]|uniref:APC family permease n=1 Tax=Specibacter cremeus TaxID=1629051 RepID=UPI000F795D52|nr:APC family permease [Specibacter cremeus]
MAQQKTTLKRNLGLWAIVGLGLGYMTPTVVFDTFGIVTQETNGAVPLAYLVALAVMFFTALSYGKMVRVFPSAGSAYTYTRETMHPGLGFFVGWAALLDYLLLPMVNALIIRIYMEAMVPDVPGWIWVVLYVIVITGLNLWSMKSTSWMNSVLVIFAVVMIAVFIVLASVKLSEGMGNGTIFSMTPLFHSGVSSTAVLTGATVVCFSFIGFDAITMYAEETSDPKVLPRAIVLTLVIGGAIFFIAGWFGQSVFPNVDHFQVTDDTLPEMALYVGGQVFQMIFVAGAFAATVASGLSSHASVSRLLFVMGRNGVLKPKKLFAYVHPRFRTPAFTVLVVGAVSLLAITPSLELVSSMINFGALIAFTFVNLSVIAYFVFRQKRYKTGKDIFSYLVLPVIGAGLTGVLWAFLHADALISGAVWLAVGVIYVAFLTKGFRRKIGDFALEETDADDADAALAGSGTDAVLEGAGER